MLLCRITEQKAPKLEDAQAALKAVRNSNLRVDQRKMWAAANAHKKKQVSLPLDAKLTSGMYLTDTKPDRSACILLSSLPKKTLQNKRRTMRGTKKGPQATEDNADTRQSR
eukprot:IDg16765t1